MAAKVINTLKKFSSRKLVEPTTNNTNNNNINNDPQRATLQRIEEGENITSTTNNKVLRTSSRRTGNNNKKESVGTGAPREQRASTLLLLKEKDKDSKGKEREKEKKSKVKKITKKTEGTTQRPKTRVHRRTIKVAEDNVVDRENDVDAESQGLMEQAEYIIESEDDDGNDYVGCYDFDKFPDVDDSPGVNFSCLTPEEIISTQKHQIQEIADLLVISASNASNLLRHYQWKTEVLHHRYWDSPEEVLKEAGLVCTAPDADDEAKFEGSGECLVCCEDVEVDECSGLRCRHRICNDCWSSYLTLKIKEGEVTRINCPALNCKLTVPDPTVQKLVNKDIYEKYLRFVTRSFVEDNAQITWCPAPRCGNAITTDMLSGTIVKCSCGFRFCFSCHHEAHAPATCEQVKLWLKKCNDDSETGHWLGANTKDCPRCMVSVEKNGGCNHMTCRQCAHEWCWMCMKPWKGHTDYYSCVRYEKAQKKKAEKAEKSKKNKKQSKLDQLEFEREVKRIALERYLTYYTKYLDYDAKVKNSSIFTEKAQQKMRALQSEQSTLAEVKFIETATEIILECQNVLKYSYVYSYYLEDNNSSEKNIFVFLQEELEKTAVTLVEVLESQAILRRRTETVDLAKLAQIKKDNLIRGVDGGLVEINNRDD